MRESQGRTKPVGRNESEKRFGVLGEIPKSVTTDGRTTGRFSCYVSGAEQECTRWDPKDGELCLSRAKPEETLVEARSGSDVQIDRLTWV